MPAKSKAQQRFMGMVRSAQKGEKPASGAVAKAAKSMEKSDVKDFASTKHKGLPNKKKKTETKVRSLIKKMVREIMKETFAGSLKKEDRKNFDNTRRKQSEVLGYKLTGKNDIKTKIGDATVKEGKLFEGKFSAGKHTFDTGANFRGNGMSIYDRNQEQGGDYKNIAHIAPSGKITIYDSKVKKSSKLMKALNDISKQFMKEGKIKEGGKGSGRPRAATPATDKDNKRPTKNPFPKESPAYKTWKKNEGKLSEEIQPSKAIQKVLYMADHGYGKLGGRVVDGMSANLFKQVYEKSNDKTREKINTMNEKQLYVFMTKLWSKFGRQVKI